MASNIDAEKTSEVTITEPFMTNGVVLPPGKHRVPMSVAEDLTRRQFEFDEDQRRLLRNGGDNIDALQGGTLRG